MGERTHRGPEYDEILQTAEVIEGREVPVMAVRYDVSSLLERELGTDWQQTLKDTILEVSVPKVIDASDPTCREEDPDQKFCLLMAPIEQIEMRFPKLKELYRGLFKHLMQESMPAGEEIRAYPGIADGMHFITQLPPTDSDRSDMLMRMDAHVDSRPTMVFVVSAPHTPSSGRLVVSNNPEAKTVREILSDATYIVHKAGTVLAFPMGRLLPHFAEHMEAGSGTRIIASVDYLGPGQEPGDPRLQEVSHRIDATK